MKLKVLVLVAIDLALLSGLLFNHYKVKAEEQPLTTEDKFYIKGALSEACTCNVPCTCNFGEGPSPHSYCYVVYAYEIADGQFNGIKLDGLRFGGIEGSRGSSLYLDARAEGDKRQALEAIARKVCRVEGEKMGGAKLLGIKYVNIKQNYDGWHDALELGDSGTFKTNYIKGRDKSKPVIVVNNTEWPIRESIKGKTESFEIKDSYGNRHSAKGTNSNHGDFDFTEATHFGSGSCSESCSPADAPAEKKHKH